MKKFLYIMSIMSITLTSSVASCLFCCGGDKDEQPTQKTPSIKPQVDDADANWKKKKVEQDANGDLRVKSLGAPLDPMSRTLSKKLGSNTDIILQPELDPQSTKQEGHQNTN